MPRDEFTDRNFSSTPALEERKHAARFDFPATAVGGRFQGVLDNTPPGELSQFAAIYSNDVVVEVTVLPTPQDAERWIADDYQPPFDAFVSKRTVKGRTVYCRPKLDIPPVVDSDGQLVKGTGVATGTAKVFWASGRFAVQVMNPDRSIEELVQVAEGVLVESD